MVIMGAVLGLLHSLFKAAYSGWNKSSALHGYVALLLTMFLFRLYLNSMEVRGNGEIFPLNGPLVLVFEYIANIFYALLIRRMSTKALTAMVIISVQGWLPLLLEAVGLQSFGRGMVAARL